MKVSKMALLLVLTDFVICLIAFIIQSIYVDDEFIYFKAVDFSRAIRIVVFSLFVMFVLSSGEDLGRLDKLNKLAAVLFLFQFTIYYIDFLKVYLAYDGIYLWKELYYIKKIGHVGTIVWFNWKINNISKQISYVNN